MPMLVAEGLGTTLELDARERQHWTVGRGHACDLILTDLGVSRYHATVFRAHDRFYVVDHSLNGTHVCAGDETPSTQTRLPTLSLPKAQAAEGGSVPDNQTPRRPRKPMEDTAEFPAVRAKAEEPDAEESFPGLHKSHAEFKLQELWSRLPRLPGYEPHALAAPKDMQPLLQLVYSAEGQDTLVSLGRELTTGCRVVFVGQQRRVMVFRD